MAANDLTYTNSATDALDLNDGIIYKLASVGGRRGLPSEIVTSETPFVAPVARYEGVNPTQRDIELGIVVFGILGTNLGTRIRALFAHFNVDHRDDALGTLTYTDFEGTQRALEVTPPVGESAPPIEWYVSGQVARSVAVTTIGMSAMDPSWYSPSWVSDTDNFSGVGDVNLSMANAGDMDGYLHITIGGVVTAPWTITDAYGSVMTFADTVDAGQTLTMYLHKQSKLFFMTHDIDGDWRGKRASSSQLIVAKYGTNNITFAGGDAGDAGAITCKHYPRYSSF